MAPRGRSGGRRARRPGRWQHRSTAIVWRFRSSLMPTPTGTDHAGTSATPNASSASASPDDTEDLRRRRAVGRGDGGHGRGSCLRLRLLDRRLRRRLRSGHHYDGLRLRTRLFLGHDLLHGCRRRRRRHDRCRWRRGRWWRRRLRRRRRLRSRRRRWDGRLVGLRHRLWRRRRAGGCSGERRARNQAEHAEGYEQGKPKPRAESLPPADRSSPHSFVLSGHSRIDPPR